MSVTADETLGRIMEIISKDEPVNLAAADTADTIEVEIEDPTKKIDLAQLKTEEGGIVLDADKFEPGEPIFIIQDDQKIPVPEGAYLMEDGSTVVVDDKGMIQEVKAKGEVEEVEEAPAEVEQSAEDPAASPSAKKVIESVTKAKESFFSAADVKEAIKTELASIHSKIDALEAANVNLSKENEELRARLENEPADSTNYNPSAEEVEVQFTIAPNREENTEDRVMKMITG